MPGDVSIAYRPPDTPEFRKVQKMIDGIVGQGATAPTIKEVEAMTKKHNLQGGIFIGFDFLSSYDGVKVVTWGANRDLCKAMGSVGGQFGDLISSGKIEP